VLLLIASAYMGLLPHSTNPTIPSELQPNDKVIHLVFFFITSLVFYWIPDISRRRAMQMTLIVCTLVLGIGSEILQGILTNDRVFDPFDILANIVGSSAAVGLCSWYHRRMMDRRRKTRFGALADGADADDDVELGGIRGASDDDDHHLEGQETGVTTRSLEHEVDNWDENAVDNWDTEDGPGPDEVTGHHQHQTGEL
jgi:hypothetical protein